MGNSDNDTSPSSKSLMNASRNSNALIHASVADELILNAGKLSVVTFVILLTLIYAFTPNDEIVELRKSEQDAARIAFWMMTLRCVNPNRHCGDTAMRIGPVTHIIRLNVLFKTVSARCSRPMSSPTSGENPSPSRTFSS